LYKRQTPAEDIIPVAKLQTHARKLGGSQRSKFITSGFKQKSEKGMATAGRIEIRQSRQRKGTFIRHAEQAGFLQYNKEWTGETK
jgi:hypothetical protein